MDLNELKQKRDEAIENFRYWDCDVETFMEAYRQGERDFRYADLSAANLRAANLSYANLRDANLSAADLSAANLRAANLSAAKNVLSAIDYLAEHFEKCESGYIAYKTFGSQYLPNAAWVIEKGAVISEVPNPERGTECGCGVNVATLNWVTQNNSERKDVWKVLIRWEWLPGVVVPFMTDGKIRCERVELVEAI